MRPTFFVFAIALLFICCKSSHIQSKKLVNKPKLPPATYCEDDVKLNDQNKNDFNNLLSLDNLAFSTAYTLIYNPTDSIQKDSLRFKIAHWTTDLIKQEWPDLPKIENHNLLSKTYNQVMFATSPLKFYNKRKVSSDLMVEGQFQNLFIEIIFYSKNQSNNTSVKIFVFDTKNNLRYLDQMNYSCDVRDFASLEKVLSYGLQKLRTKF
ncbi:hypothetical protein GZ212_14560 [Mangrovimonas sp. CR14]|uniref:hypothetical protein n=1 Tax=Mangrovimonas sp. CR14 TaxID=2706120 RepID=UPI00141DD042|nr:hypothetical protein [Mangrovimonas sp. CR14]NIK93382.1 hypothetical protein [Mangrovimonas sp. CR14]